MNNELFSRLKDLAQKENRARLAVLLGAAAMLLILLQGRPPQQALPRRMTPSTASSLSSSFPTSSRR